MWGKRVACGKRTPSVVDYVEVMTKVVGVGVVSVRIV